MEIGPTSSKPPEWSSHESQEIEPQPLKAGIDIEKVNKFAEDLGNRLWEKYRTSQGAMKDKLADLIRQVEATQNALNAEPPTITPEKAQAKLEDIQRQFRS